MHQARIEYKCTQLIQSLQIPEGYAVKYTDDSASLKEILRRQHNTRGLTIVSDEAFTFFKYVYCKMKQIQTFQYLETHRKEMLQHTEIQLKCDEKVIDLWCILFSKPDECTCKEDTQLEVVDNSQNLDVQMLDYELEQCLVLDMLDKVLHYFVSVHLSDTLGKYKDIVMQKKKTVSHRHAILCGLTDKQLNPNKVDFPCGTCRKECMEMANLKDPQFEDHSVGCNKCQKWYLICVKLDGTEEYVQENSNLEYYCPNCTSKHPELLNVMQQTHSKMCTQRQGQRQR